MSRTVVVRSGPSEVLFANNGPLAVIAGPCVIESEQHALGLAQAIREIAGPYVFKASFDKANRSSVNSYRGPGLRDGLRILSEV
ncbi:MAG TPA: 3-deoxy-8-phosphooctulonate synthase, partial [Bryobacteraceae bacterium]